jgi:hypothetical protein
VDHGREPFYRNLVKELPQILLFAVPRAIAPEKDDTLTQRRRSHHRWSLVVPFGFACSVLD